jgi:hypothetical protein
MAVRIGEWLKRYRFKASTKRALKQLITEEARRLVHDHIEHVSNVLHASIPTEVRIGEYNRGYQQAIYDLMDIKEPHLHGFIAVRLGEYSLGSVEEVGGFRRIGMVRNDHGR